jgi:hypothetical protein
MQRCRLKNIRLFCQTSNDVWFYAIVLIMILSIFCMFMTPANTNVKFHQNPLSLTVSGFMFATCKTSGFVVIDYTIIISIKCHKFFSYHRKWSFLHFTPTLATCHV